MSKLIFEPTAKRQLDALAANLPQSLLLTGSDGVGLLAAAKYVAGDAAAIIQPTDKDGNVSASGSIKLDSILQLRQQSRGRTTGRVVFIIDDADRMNHRAQNAFLKLLEEPAPQIHFILTSHAPHLLLATILSRVERLGIKQISPEQTQQIMRQLKISDPQVEQQLLFLASGRPAALTRLAKNPTELEKIGQIVRDAQQFIRAPGYERAVIAARYTDRSSALQFLSHCLTILSNNLRRNPSRKLVRQSEQIVETYQRIAANGNVRLQLIALAV